MNMVEINLDSKIVLVFDAPENATHSKFSKEDNSLYNICRKNKVLESTKLSFGDNIENVVDVGAVNLADESIIADLFVPIKRGNFYDYQYNGVFYPNAKSAFQDMISERCTFKNPYAIILYI